MAEDFQLSPPLSPASAPTVVEVARLADVSLGTVSRVLNAVDSVRPEVRARVLAAMSQLEYRRLRRRPGPGAPARRRRRRGALGVLVLGAEAPLAELPFLAAALHGIERAAAAERYQILFAGVVPGSGLPDFLRRGRVDGLLLAAPATGPWPDGIDPDLAAAVAALPQVWLAGRPGGAAGDEASGDLEGAAGLAMQHLQRQGHRRVGFLNLPARERGAERLRLGLGLHGERLGVHLRVFDAAPPDADCETLVERWLALPERGRPTALLVPSDRWAALLYAALLRRGLRVGTDVGVLSLLREPAGGAGLQPALATVDLQPEAVGRRAVERLLGRIRHPADPLSTRVVVDPVLLVGDSVGQVVL
jgi:DNA-binding LacI/PurR family transcriptional regulator